MGKIVPVSSWGAGPKELEGLKRGNIEFNCRRCLQKGIQFDTGGKDVTFLLERGESLSLRETRNKECVCVCVCVCERERERERVGGDISCLVQELPVSKFV